MPEQQPCHTPPNETRAGHPAAVDLHSVDLHRPGFMHQSLTPTQADLLYAAFWQGPEAATAWQRWRDVVDWDGHIEPGAYALLPFIYRNLRGLQVSEPLLPRFKGVMRHAWLANQGLLAQLRDTLGECARADVRVLVLPPTQRLILDASAVTSREQPLCWAVRPQQAERVLRCLLGGGWRSVDVHLPRWSLLGYTLGSRHLLLRHDNGLQLMLTWGLEWWFGDQAEPVWGRAVRERIGQRSLLILDPTDALEFELRRPRDADPFASMAAVLGSLAAAPGDLDWTRLQTAIHQRPLIGEWSQAQAFLQPFFEQRGAPANPQRWSVPAAGADPQPFRRASLGARWIADWRLYRCALGEGRGLGTALIQLPGYLMGKWRLRSPGALARGLVTWINVNPRTTGNPR